MTNNAVFYGNQHIANGIRSRLIEDVNGLTMHVLEAGYDEVSDIETADKKRKPTIIFLHGFPELAFSFRHQLSAFADAGYHVIAPDQRGYGLTTGWDARYDGDVASFRMFNLAKDIVYLATRLGLDCVDGIVGHDFGSPVAAWCALIRPDLFHSLALMSAPFGGPPPASMNRDKSKATTAVDGRGRPVSMNDSLAALEIPRIHYQTYYSTEPANADMCAANTGLRDFFKGYYFLKSAAYKKNMPAPLDSWAAEQLAKLPRYYVMDLDKTMPQTVDAMMHDQRVSDAEDWLTDDVMDVYADAYSKTGFQGGLNWYRCSVAAEYSSDLTIFTGRKIEVPACYIAGAADWGIHQSPGQLEKMQTKACTEMTVMPFIQGAGHWLQQEKPETVSHLLLDFFAKQHSN
jgi:pimeloyl-ACP methyl ester carboxylesterase